MPENYNDFTRSILDEMNLEVDEDEKDDDEEEEEEDFVEEEEEEEEVDESEDDEDDDEEEDEEGDGLTGDESFQHTPTKEEKAHYAFKKLREENKELGTKIEKLDELAKAYGFASHDDMLTKLEEDKMRKEAASKKVDPDYYVELRKTQKRVEELESLRKMEYEKAALNKFVTDLDNFAKEFSLNDGEKTALVQRMEEDGITANDVVKWKNPRAVFKGYVEDKIVKRVEQRQIDKSEKRKKLKEERHGQSPDNPKISMDALVEYAMKKRKDFY